MCKLLCIVDIENVDLAKRFLIAAKGPMTRTDSHGLGIIRLGANGLGVQRWLDPKNYPTRRDTFLSSYASLLREEYNETGISGTPFALGMHSRFATCARTLENVHPFIRNGSALIHNGIITNHQDFKKEVSTCDSEALLSSYLESSVSDSIDNVQSVVNVIDGSYAFMVFNEKGYVDIVKDGTSLHISHVSGVGTVFCTTEQIIRTAARSIKRKVTSVQALPAYVAIRWMPGIAPQIIDLREPEPPASSFLNTHWKGIENLAQEKEWTRFPPGIDYERCEHGKAVGDYCEGCLEKDLPKTEVTSK